MNIPIIGQPKIGDWSFSFILECPCGARHIFAGKPGTVLACPCRRQFALRGHPVFGQDGTINIPLLMREGASDA